MDSRGMIASRHCIPLKHLRVECRLGQLRRYHADTPDLKGGDEPQSIRIFPYPRNLTESTTQ